MFYHGKIGKLEMIIITSRDPSPPGLDYLKVSGGIFRDTQFMTLILPDMFCRMIQL